MSIHENFFSVRTVEDEEHDTTSTMQAVYLSATVAWVASLSVGSWWACAQFVVNAASMRWSPSIPLTDHSTRHEAPRVATAVVAPHVPALISITGFSFTHGLRLLFLHVQTHCVSKHDWLWRKSQNRNIRNNRECLREGKRVIKHCACWPYLGPQNSLHSFRAVKGNKSKVGQFPNRLGVDPQVHNLSVCWMKKRKCHVSVQLVFFLN